MRSGRCHVRRAARTAPRTRPTSTPATAHQNIIASLCRSQARAIERRPPAVVRASSSASFNTAAASSQYGAMSSDRCDTLFVQGVTTRVHGSLAPGWETNII
jgi:hypothetical protein